MSFVVSHHTGIESNEHAGREDSVIIHCDVMYSSRIFGTRHCWTKSWMVIASEQHWTISHCSQSFPPLAFSPRLRDKSWGGKDWE